MPVPQVQVFPAPRLEQNQESSGPIWIIGRCVLLAAGSHPQLGPKYADRFYKALVGVRFQGVDPFEFRLNALIQHFGSAKKAEQFAQDRGSSGS